MPEETTRCTQHWHYYAMHFYASLCLLGCYCECNLHEAMELENVALKESSLNSLQNFPAIRPLRIQSSWGLTIESKAWVRLTRAATDWIPKDDKRTTGNNRLTLRESPEWTIWWSSNPSSEEESLEHSGTRQETMETLLKPSRTSRWSTGRQLILSISSAQTRVGTLNSSKICAARLKRRREN